MEPPDILEGFGLWLDDFWRLSTEREIGFGVGPIPASAIDKHVEGWGYEDAELFERCIRAMDGVYLMRSNKTDDPDHPQITPGEPPRFADLARRA